MQTQFDVTFDRDSESVLRGVEWSIPINIGGVYENKDFSIDVIEGKSLFSELVKDRPRSYLKGMGSSNGNIQISAIRLGDGKTRTASIEIRAYDPQYESNNDNIEIYVDEDFDFDARIKEVESSRISATVLDNITNITSDYKTANFTLGPYKTDGEVQVKLKVDGKRVNLLDRKIIIKKPPPPSIEVIEKTLSTIQFKVITYGKNNELKYEFPEKGLISLNRLPEVVKPQQNIKEYQLRGSIRPPQASEGSQIEIEFFVTDKYGKRTEFSRTYVIQ